IFQLPGVRAQLVAALPAGLLLLLVSRWSWRRWLCRQRAEGRFASRALVVGTRDDIEYVIRSLGTSGMYGYSVVGTATSDPDMNPIAVGGRSYDVVGTTHTVAASARAMGADSIIIASTDLDDPDMIKRISWQLEGTA